MTTLPLPPRGFSASLAQLWKLSHLPPFYISPHIHFAPFQTLQVHTAACSQFLFTILWFLSAAREKNIHLIRCAWHITLHLSVHLSLPRFSFPKRSEGWAKSSQSSNLNPVDKEQMKVPLGLISNFSRGDAVGPTHCCGRSLAYPASILSSALGKQKA